MSLSGCFDSKNKSCATITLAPNYKIDFHYVYGANNPWQQLEAKKIILI
jgi:hypothetical protein